MKRLVVVALTSALFVLSSQLPALAWTVSVIDQNVNDGFPSLAVSLSDHVWVAWHQGPTLLWAKWTGSNWQTTQVADFSITGCVPDRAPSAGFVPTDGTARIASLCYGPDTGGSDGRDPRYPAHIMFTFRSPSNQQWVTQPIKHVPTAHCSGTYPALVSNVSLAFDPRSGAPGIAYADSATGHVYWMHLDGSRWHMETAGLVVGDRCDPFGAAWVSAAYDPIKGTPAIAWTSQMESVVHYSTFSAANDRWTTLVTGDAPTDGAGISLAFTPSGTPWIAFTERTADDGEALAVTTSNGSSWSDSIVDSAGKRVGHAPSIAMKGSLPRIASYDDTRGDLRFAADTGSSWTLSTLDSSGQTGLFPSLDFSSVGDPFIAYRFWKNPSVMGVKWARPSS